MAVLRLPTSLRGGGMPCIDTRCRLLALRTILGTLEDVDHPARRFALYFLGPSRRALVPRALGNLHPSAESVPPFHQAVVNLDRKLLSTFPDLAVREVSPARIFEEICTQHVTPGERRRADAFPWAQLVSRRLPRLMEDFEWRRGWEVLQTRQRLHRWGMVPNPHCPKCVQVEKTSHVFRGCQVA